LYLRTRYTEPIATTRAEDKSKITLSNASLPAPVTGNPGATTTGTPLTEFVPSQESPEIVLKPFIDEQPAKYDMAIAAPSQGVPVVTLYPNAVVQPEIFIVALDVPLQGLPLVTL
jgi:hypothetical protein